MTSLLTPLFTFLAGVANSFMDLSAENRFIDNKYNKTEGGDNDENKWKQPKEEGKRVWWYLWFLYKPKYKEAFIWSSTALVSLTDWWHRFQSLMLIFFCLAIVCYVPILGSLVSYLGWKAFFIPILDFLLCRITFSIGFELFYKNIKNKLEKKRENIRNSKK